MTQNWSQIRQVLFYWMVASACLAAFFGLSTMMCGVTECSNSTMRGLNLLGLFGIMVSALVAVYALMRTNAQLLFTPIVAYAGACALFYGFGPMSSFLASQETLAFQAQSIYAIDAQAVLRTNLLSSVGITISIGAIMVFLPRQNRVLSMAPSLSIESVAIIFVVTGLALKHLIVMPSIYGTFPIQLPGIIQNLRYLPDLGFALMAMIGASGNKRWATAFWLIWPLHFLLAFPEFSKKSVMLTMLLPAIGAYIGHRSIARLAMWVVPAMVLFSTLQNINTFARYEENQAVIDNQVLGVADRLDILGDAAVNDESIEAYLPVSKQGVETWWLRLNFSGPQNAAMELRDSDVGSAFTQNPLIYIVPRFLWPDKPTLVSPGQQFHQTVTQNPNSQTRVGITVFADGYWKLGWPGLILFSSIMGGIMAVIARMTMNQLSRGLYLYLPAAALGIQLGGSSSTAFLQNAFLSGLPVYFGYCIVVALIYGQLGQLRHRSRETRMAYGAA